MKTALLLLICSAIGLMQPAPVKKFRLNDALKKNLATATAVSLGGHQGECIELTISNLADHDTTIYIEAGRRLVSADTSEQDILIVKEQPLFVRAGQTITTRVYGFCCQASFHSPAQGGSFYAGELADTNLRKLAEFLNANPYSNSVMQNAVWVVSDNHAIASVHASDSIDKTKIRKLHNFLSALLGLPNDQNWYTLTYLIDTNRLFSGMADTLYADFEYEVWNPCGASLIINDEQGNVMKRLFVNKKHHPDKYLFSFKISVEGWPKGKYYVRLFANDQKKAERIFEI
jgi:hypothetical protein